MPPKAERVAPGIVRARITGEVGHTDYNGTLGPVGGFPARATVHTLTEWAQAGNVWDFSSSDNWPQGQRKFGSMATGTRGVELGVGAHDLDGKLIIFNPLSPSELARAGEVSTKDIPYHFIAFLPRFEPGVSNHGMTMYVNPRADKAAVDAYQARYGNVEYLTTKKEQFARLLASYEGEVGMVTFKMPDEYKEPFLELASGLVVAEDSSHHLYVTPQGVTKATTLMELLDGYYKRKPDETIWVGGDSPATDGSFFTVDGARKLAVGSGMKELVRDTKRRGISGTIFEVKSPEGARRVLANHLKSGGR